MTKVSAFISWLAIAGCLTSCTSQVWLPDERSGLSKMNANDFSRFGGITPTRNIFERTISVPINPNDASTKYFDLYYYVRMPSTRAAKTVLFLPGGPGQFIPGPISFPTLADFLISNGYNVVLYHPRGAGFSQISPSNNYDRFLKTYYVLDDIEAIRRDFLGAQGKWDAVIGYSFGTVVAQQYTGVYGNNAERLILIGTQSRHGFQSLPSAFDQIADEIRNINRYTITQILQRPEFSNLTTAQKNLIVDTAFGSNNVQGIFQKAEEKFGSLAFVVSAYCDLKAQNELASNNLDYSQQLFRALRGLRDVGWYPRFNRQVDYVKDIRDEILGTASGVAVADCGPDVTGSSDRVFNVVSIYDGINMRFLSKWLANGKTNLRDAVRASGGEAHYNRGINKYLGKIGISESDAVENWDPARFKYDKPTIILKGTADTVPAGGAAEHIFLNALSGSRTLIEYPGVGHLYVTPALPSSFQSNLPGNPAACVPTQPPTQPLRDCLIYSFLEMSPGVFKDPSVNRILPLLMNDGASICYRDQSMSQTVAGTCP